MHQRATDLSKRIASFQNEVMAFVDVTSPEQWCAISEWVHWRVGAVVRHLGSGHLGGFANLRERIVAGKDRPQLTTV